MRQAMSKCWDFLGDIYKGKQESITKGFLDHDKECWFILYVKKNPKKF